MDTKVVILIAIVVWLLSLTIIWISGVSKRRVLSKELKELKRHLHNQMEINVKGLDAQEKELMQLRTKNKNLQTTIATLKAKNSTEEKMMLLLYDKSIHLMYEKAPGFATSWEMILKEAQTEIDKLSDGSAYLSQKIIRPSFLSKTVSALKRLRINE